MRIEQITSRKDEITRIADRYGATNIRVFGSVSRGDADNDSDIDFLVDLERGRSLLDLGGLLMDLQSRLGRRVDVVTEKGLRPRIRERVLREARAI
ncbi:MAG: nucleotidyltransferase family protein [Acidobacteria bacterium]|nr:nucleotidyltransferase family protein [Acidobacteriota bacterium]